MRRTLVLAVLLGALAGCDEGGGAVALSIELVGADYLNPVAEHGSGRVTLRIEQLDGATIEETHSVSSDAFDILTPIDSYVLLTRVQVLFELDDAPQLIGASPTFLPFTAGLVRIPVGAPSSCEALSEPELPDGRLEPAVVPFGGNHWVIGGATASGGHDLVGVYAPYHLTIERGYSEEALPDPLEDPLRETQAVLLTPERILVLSSADGRGTARILEHDDTDGFTERAIEGLDPAIGTDSTLVDLGSFGAAIVGGTDRSARVHWLNDSGDVVRTTSMLAPRRRPAVVFTADALIVAGGQAEGDPEVELVGYQSDGTAIPGAATTVRDRPVAVRAPSRETMARGSALILGGTDAGGALLASTLLVTGCPSACTIAPHDPWLRPRLAPAIVETALATLLLGGHAPDGTASDARDRLVFAGTSLSWEQDGSLEHARAHATAIEIANGIVVLVGGERAPSDPIRGFEMCWPPQLEGVSLGD